MKLQTRTECNIGGVDDEWDTEDIEEGGKLEQAIDEVKEDHSVDQIVDAAESIWLFRVYWNDNTDSVWVSRYGYNGGMEAQHD